jgi:hypothetical protein
MPDKTIQRAVTIAGHRFELASSDIVRALKRVDPEPVSAHYVVVAGRRFPPKQVISEVTGLDRADFTSHQARRTLMRLGFSAGRRTTSAARSRSGRGSTFAHTVAIATQRERLADRLQDLAGQWVAIRDDDVLHSAATPQELVGWLTRHGETAETMFRVPEDEITATGLAPL